jgi:hypothetical protein
MIVKSELDKLGLHYIRVELGETEIMEDISIEQIYSLKVALKSTGLELIDDKKSILVEKIKRLSLNWPITLNFKSK